MGRISDISVFVRIVEHGGFTAAAKGLAISPASVSGILRTLEKRLGVQLMHRTTRNVCLTGAGNAFYERCIRILAELAEAEQMVTALQSKPHGTLRLNTSVYIASLVTPVIGDYAKAHPDVSFDMTMTDRMVDMVRGRYDLALRSEPLPDSNLITRRLGIGQLLLTAAPAYLTRHGVPRKPGDLLRHNCLIGADSLTESQWHFDGADGNEPIEVTGNLRTNSIEGLRAATLAGHGISLLPSVSVREDLKVGRLVRLLPDYRTKPAVIQGVYLPSSYLPPKVRTFLDLLAVRWSKDVFTVCSFGYPEKPEPLRIA